MNPTPQRYNLGANSTLVVNDLSVVSPILEAAGVKELLPMVSSYPYPPEFLDWMRQVFAYPGPFIQQCIDEAKANGYTGWNIDWEPSDPKKVKPGDAEAYAAFLDTFAKAMHEHSLTVTVDVASWSPIWNFDLLAETEVDLLETMSTYTDNPDTWDKQLDAALASIPLAKLRVGLETMRNDGSPYDPKELARRFGRLADADVRSIGLWKSPVPDEWWPFLNKFAANA